MSLQNLLKKNNYSLYINSANISSGLVIGDSSNDALSIYDQIFGTLSVTGFSAPASLNYNAVITGKNVVIDINVPDGTIGGSSVPLQFTLPVNLRPRTTYFFPVIAIVNNNSTSGIMDMSIAGLCSIYPNIDGSSPFTSGTPFCGLIGTITLSYILA